MKKLVLLPLITLSIANASDVKLAFEYEKINVKKDTTLVDDNLNDIDSVAVSDDGNQICWIGKETKRKSSYPINLYFKDTSSKVSEKPTKIKKALLNAFTKCAFDNIGNIMTSELKWRPGAIVNTLYHSYRTGDFEPKTYQSVLRIYDTQTNSVISEVNALELGQKSKKEFIKHPRVSPDGKWVTFYTMGNFGTEGVYLYHVETKRIVHLGQYLDKHPTWSPDGSKILFHHQVSNRKEGGLEMSYLGYYDLNFSGIDTVEAKRILLDDMTKEGYSYHKHPAMYPDTNLLFFHGQEKPDGKKNIYVRSLEVNSKIYKLNFKKLEVALKKAKHPAVARNNSGLYFLGKEDQEGAKYKIYRLEPKLIKNLKNLVK